MPKIRDLGINVIPETMRPPEIGGGGGGKGGGGGGDCEGATYQCPAGTVQTGANTCYGYAQQCPAGTVVQTTNTCYGYAQQCTAGTVQSGNTCYGYAQQCTAGTAQQTTNTCYGDAGQCTAGTLVTTSPHLVHAAAAQTGQAAAAGLTREAIAVLRQQLQQQIAQLDELAKSVGPTTAEEIDAREQQLKAELEELANRRNSLTTPSEE